MPSFQNLNFKQQAYVCIWSKSVQVGTHCGHLYHFILIGWYYSCYSVNKVTQNHTSCRPNKALLCPWSGLHKRTDANGWAEEAAGGDSDADRRRPPEEACGRHGGHSHSVYDSSATTNLSGQVESAVWWDNKTSFTSQVHTAVTSNI